MALFVVYFILPICNGAHHRLSHTHTNFYQERLNNECAQLVKDIWRIGDPEKPNVPFGQLFDDDEVQQYYEALAATLKAAKKRECFATRLDTRPPHSLYS